MRKNGFFYESTAKNKGTTYINGLGFVYENRARAEFFLIRANSNIICSCTIMYYILKQLFILPSTYAIYFCGADIQINFLTGLISSTPFSKATIMLLANFMALFFSCAFCFLANRKKIHCAKIFKKPYKGVTSLAVPMTIAVGMCGVGLGLLFIKLFTSLGLVFQASIFPINSIDAMTFYTIIITIILAIVQEIFFRGIILTILRQFGDSFAVIATSLLFALWSGGLPQFISHFLVSLPLCYFAIRSGSVYTSIISRIFLELIIFGYCISIGILPKSIGLIVVLAVSLLTILYAGYAFIKFIKNDKTAFNLKKANDNLTTSVKVSIFSSGIVFIVFSVIQIIEVVHSTQVIG